MFNPNIPSVLIFKAANGYAVQLSESFYPTPIDYTDRAVIAKQARIMKEEFFKDDVLQKIQSEMESEELPPVPKKQELFFVFPTFGEAAKFIDNHFRK